MTPRRWVLAGAAVLFLWWLGGHDLWAPDEPYFAEGAREMIVDGQWAVPHVNGKVTPDKPPLFFWLIALLSLPVGEVTPLTARLPSALAALGTVALTLRLGRRLYGPATAALAGGMLATSFLFWDKARWSQTDALLCFLIWVALSAFEAWRAGDAGGRRAGLLFWLAAALAVLTKGPVGLLLPLGIALVVLALERDLVRWRGFAPLAGPAVFTAVAGAWVAWATLGGPSDYSVWGALREHFIDRGLHGMHHRQPWWYFLERLPQSLMPWSGLIPGALVLAWRRRGRGDRLLAAAALFVILFFSISTEKRELYALPSLPAFTLLMAALVARVATWRESEVLPPVAVDRRWVTVGQGVIGGLLALVGLALPLAVGQLEGVPVPRALLLTLAGTFATAGVATVVFSWRGRVVASIVAPASGCVAIYLLVVTLAYPAMEPVKSARPFTATIARATADSRAAGLPVVAYRLDNLPEHFAFWGGGLYTVETGDPELLRRHLERPERVWAVVHGGALEPLPPELLERLWVTDTTRLARRDVLLVANHELPGARRLSEVVEARPGARSDEGSDG